MIKKFLKNWIFDKKKKKPIEFQNEIKYSESIHKDTTKLLYKLVTHKLYKTEFTKPIFIDNFRIEVGRIESYIGIWKYGFVVSHNDVVFFKGKYEEYDNTKKGELIHEGVWYLDLRKALLREINALDFKVTHGKAMAKQAEFDKLSKYKKFVDVKRIEHD